MFQARAWFSLQQNVTCSIVAGRVMFDAPGNVAGTSGYGQQRQLQAQMLVLPRSFRVEEQASCLAVE